MCSRFEAPTNARLQEVFGIAPDRELDQLEIWPARQAPFLRSGPVISDEGGDQPSVEALIGTFGLLPFWAEDKLARSTYNARSETVAQRRSFQSAWKKAQHAIIPVEAFYEPDWRSGKAVPTRFTRKDGELIGVAGLWEERKTLSGIQHSFTMLTVNADDHPLLNQYHKLTDEKRMIVLLPKGSYRDWLNCPAAESDEFMRQYPADRLFAESVAR